MVETIWSAIAVVGGLGMCAVIPYFLVTGRNDRDEDEEARAVLRRARPLAGRVARLDRAGSVEPLRASMPAYSWIAP